MYNITIQFPDLLQHQITIGIGFEITSFSNSFINRVAVADMTALNALVLDADFKKGDCITVNVDDDGEKGKYQYLYDVATTSFKWVKIGSLSTVGFL